jgi:hypothetical protein
MSRIRNSHFQRGTGVFKCEGCGRQTRTTHQPDNTRYCYECWELAGYQNSIWDGEKPADIAAPVRALLATIVERGGSAAAVRADLVDLFKAIDSVNEDSSCQPAQGSVELTQDNTRTTENQMHTQVVTTTQSPLPTKRPRSAAQVAAFAKLQADKAAKRAAAKAPVKAAKAAKGAKAAKLVAAKDTNAVKLVAAKETPTAGTYAPRFDENQKISIPEELRNSNPKKPGCASWEKWELQRKCHGKTVGYALKLGVAVSSLRWSVNHGFMRIA